MVDVFDPDKRSEVMSGIRSKNTSLELFVRHLVFSAGFRYRLCSGRLPGRPDLVLRKWRVVVFVNGCFWHVHRGCRRAVEPKSNVDFWRKKLQNNVRRDAENHARLKSLGWRVLVIWECACRSAFADALLAEMDEFIRSESGPDYMEVGRDQMEEKLKSAEDGRSAGSA